MFKLQGCPRCHGDLYSGRDAYGTYFSCVQCGRYFEAIEIPDRAERRPVRVPDAGPPVEVELELAA